MCSARWGARRRGGRLGAKPEERVSDGVLGAHLGVVAVRLDLYNRARNDAANTHERPAREVGGGIEFKHPCAAKNARGAPSVKRGDHLLLFAFAWVVHNEEGCHRSRAQRPRKLDAGPGNSSPGAFFTSRNGSSVSSSAPNTLPVFGLTMWTCLQARQVTAS